MKTENTRPGVMIYFNDIKPFTQFFRDEQLGELVRAILNYAQFGEWLSEDSDPAVRLALGVFKDKIDRDAEAYERKKLHGQYMTYARQAKEANRECLSEQEWIAMVTAQTKAANRSN